MIAWEVLCAFVATVSFGAYIVCFIKNIVTGNRQGGGANHAGALAGLASAGWLWGVFADQLGFWRGLSITVTLIIILPGIEVLRQQLLQDVRPMKQKP